MPACSFGIWILFLHVNRSIRMKTDENSLYLGAFHRRKPPAENASLHACRAHDNHPPPLAAFVRRQCGGFRRAALRWAGAPGRRRATQRQPPPPRRRTSPAPATVARGTQEGWGIHGGRRRLAARGPKGPRACQTKKQGPEAKPRPCFSGRFAPRRRPRAAGFSTAAKKATQSPAPRSMGPGTPIHGRKRRGNGPAPWGKAAAHALRAAAAQPACRGPLSQGNPTRCCATIAARVGPPPA